MLAADKQFTEEIDLPEFPLEFWREFVSTIWDDFRPGHEGGFVQFVGIRADNEGAHVKCQLSFLPMDRIPEMIYVDAQGNQLPTTASNKLYPYRYVGNPLKEIQCSVARS